MLVTHGDRNVLRTAAVAQSAGKPLDRMRAWAMDLQARANYNKAACALANKMARICSRISPTYGKIDTSPAKAGLSLRFVT